MTSKDVRDIMQLSVPGSSTPSLQSSINKKPLRNPSTNNIGGSRKGKRPAGVTRELYALIGNNSPSLTLGPTSHLGGSSNGKGSKDNKPVFKQKLSEGKKGTSGSKWSLISFVNPSRGANKDLVQYIGQQEQEKKVDDGEDVEMKQKEYNDDDEQSNKQPSTSTSSNNSFSSKSKLQLKHWVRDLPSTEPIPVLDNKFVKFNTSSQPLMYNDEEYNRWLRNLDTSWTRDETDYLFNLAQMYDLRFIVMHDRWDYNSERSLEMLKQRYYSIARELLKQRPAPIGMSSDEKSQWDKQRQDAISSMQFDMNREVERKAYLKSLLSRTPQQIAEEDFLYIETRRIEQQYNKMAFERNELLKLLGGREGIGSVQGALQIGGSGSGGAGGNNNPSSSGGLERGSNVGASGSGSSGNKGGSGSMGNHKDGESGPGGHKKKKGPLGWEFEGLNGGGLPEGWAGEGSVRKATAAQDAANCIERHPAPSVAAPKANPWPSVGVRSSRIASVKPGVAVKVSNALVELGMSTHLIMPTKQNIEKLDQLQSTLATMIEIKKALDRLSAEIKTVTKKRDALIVASGGNVPAPTASASATPAPETKGSEAPTPAPTNDDGTTDAEQAEEVKKEEAGEEAEENSADKEGGDDAAGSSRNKRSASASSVPGAATKRARRD